MANIPESSSLQPPKKPRSSARDLQGFSQRELWNYIKAENLKLSAYKLAFIIKNAANIETGDQLIHRTSKIILKKKERFCRNMERCTCNNHNSSNLHDNR